MFGQKENSKHEMSRVILLLAGFFNTGGKSVIFYRYVFKHDEKRKSSEVFFLLFKYRFTLIFNNIVLNFTTVV